MRYSYQEWKARLMDEDVHAMAIVSFPYASQCSINIRDLIQDGDLQYELMRGIADACPHQEAFISMMDLSVEAEAFGCSINFPEGEVPSITDHIINSKADGERLQIPDMHAGRLHTFVQGVERMTKESDRPVFGGVCGPFSLAGRLMGVSEIMMQCIMDPSLVHLVLRKVTDFLKRYILAYKEVHASGVLLAEPLAGLLSPQMTQEFSSVYIRELCDELQEDAFTILYHNCGPNTVQSLPEILHAGCGGWHFGNAVDMQTILEHVPADQLVMGNLDPVRCFCDMSLAELEIEERKLLQACGKYSNFVLSTGCDVPPKAKWENIQKFYEILDKVNRERRAYVL